MKFSVIKTIDGVGRMVLPKSIRDYYGIVKDDKLLVTPTESGILITRLEDSKERDNLIVEEDK